MKRLMDIILALLILFIMFPIILIAALSIRIESKGSVLFKQDRLGKEGKVFTLYKLRSLRQNNDRQEKQIFKDHPEMTAVGKFIRRFKIDELPQIFNVLKGDMSIVGPRPSLPSLMEKFDENAYYRLKVRPGLTGWAQINGNVYNSWPKRWILDRYYVENWSILFDIKIIIATIGVILFGEEK
ncbi:MAG: sugar transferase [Bacteroidales bacterium]|nr:sugar transferase [Bacteroidales bacterium]